jgi:DNA-binding NarL/FixJ family response regulator
LRLVNVENLKFEKPDTLLLDIMLPDKSSIELAKEIRDLVERGLETRRLMQAPVHLEETDDVREDGDVLVGRSPQMLEV